MRKSMAFKILIACMLVVHFVNTDIHAQAPNKVVSGIEWANTTFDFGKIPQGKPVVAEFQFKNPSMIPLIVYAVKPSCGCTVAEYTKEPIQPQKTGIIKVTFDAKDSGYFQKSVTVDTNAGEGIETLVIKGEVISS